MANQEQGPRAIRQAAFDRVAALLANGCAQEGADYQAALIELQNADAALGVRRDVDFLESTYLDG